MEKHWIHIPLYNGNLYVIDTKDVEQAVKDTQYNEYILDSSESCLISQRSGDFYLYIDLQECSMGLLAHELFHATHRILEYFGVEFTRDNHEPFAYLMEYLVNECHKLKIKQYENSKTDNADFVQHNFFECICSRYSYHQW